ncbi:MAG: response regulator [Acidobacteria bacterium]|nr:response regulator [Acidobacteriota bacterium]
MQSRPILVIDDDPLFREVVRDILTQADFEVLAAADGFAGIELARKVQPAVIVLDMLLPEMDGLSALELLKRDPALKAIPVVGVTVSADLTYAQRAFRAGAMFFLPKPVSPTSLVCVVELAAGAASPGAPMRRRRRHPRFAAKIPVQCTIQSHGEVGRELMGQTENVSLAGLLLWLPEPMPPGTAVRLRLELPGSPVTAKGTVRWQDAQPAQDDRFRHGIQLTRFTGDSAPVRYRRFLSQLLACPAP